MRPLQLQLQLRPGKITNVAISLALFLQSDTYPEACQNFYRFSRIKRIYVQVHHPAQSQCNINVQSVIGNYSREIDDHSTCLLFAAGAWKSLSQMSQANILSTFRSQTVGLSTPSFVVQGQSKHLLAERSPKHKSSAALASTTDPVL